MASPPDSAAPDGSAAAHAAEGDWWLRVPEGVDFGPLSGEQLRRWVSEGRVDAKCLLRQEASPAWQRAEAWFPELGPMAPAPAAMPTAFAPPAKLAELNRSPGNLPAAPPASSSGVRPHRGPLLLGLAVASWVSCPLLGVAAWWMATQDLNQMRFGRVDAAGGAATQAAQIVGLAHAIVSLLVILLGMFAGLFGWFASG